MVILLYYPIVQKSLKLKMKEKKYWQTVYRMVKNSYYCIPHFDLKSWTIDNIDTKKSK